MVRAISKLTWINTKWEQNKVATTKICHTTLMTVPSTSSSKCSSLTPTRGSRLNRPCNTISSRVSRFPANQKRYQSSKESTKSWTSDRKEMLKSTRKISRRLPSTPVLRMDLPNLEVVFSSSNPRSTYRIWNSKKVSTMAVLLPDRKLHRAKTLLPILEAGLLISKMRSMTLVHRISAIWWNKKALVSTKIQVKRGHISRWCRKTIR